MAAGWFIREWQLWGDSSTAAWALPGSALAGVMLPFWVEWLLPGSTGVTYFFMSATVGYLGGGALLLTLLAGWARLTRHDFSWWQLAWFLPLTAAVALFHEGLAIVSLAVAVFMPFAVDKRGRRFWILDLAGGALSLGRFFLPGMWARSNLMSTDTFWRSLSKGQRLVVHGATSYVKLVEWLGYPAVSYIVLMLVMLGYWRWRLEGRKWFYTLVLGVNIAALGASVLFSYRQNRTIDIVAGDLTRLTGLHLQTYLRYSYVIFVLLMVLALTLLLLLFWVRKTTHNRLIGVLLLLPLAAWVVPAASGGCTTRPLFFAFALGILAIMGMLWELLGNRGKTLVRLRAGLLTAIVLGCLGVGLVTAGQIIRFHGTNLEVWGQLQQEIAQSRDSKTAIVHIPKKLPQDKFCPEFLGDDAGYQQFLRQYFQIPPETTFQVVPPES